MFVSTLVIGLVLGGTYALIAMGLTIQYGVARIMNLAYGETVIAGAFLVLLLNRHLALSPILGLVLAVPSGFLLAWAIYQLLLSPLVRRTKDAGKLEIDSILLTFGLMFLAQGLMIWCFGSGLSGYSWLQAPVEIAGAKIASGRVLGLAFAFVIGVGLWLLIERTRWGINLRAVATNPEFAPLVGIDRDRSAAMAFALGGAIAAAGGAVVSMYQSFTAVDGSFLTMKALVIVIMGGLGNIGGALVAGLILGVVEAFVSTIDPGLTLAATYVIFLGVLLWRPQGLFS